MEGERRKEKFATKEEDEKSVEGAHVSSTLSISVDFIGGNVSK